jgi:hypothetical protein
MTDSQNFGRGRSNSNLVLIIGRWDAAADGGPLAQCFVGIPASHCKYKIPSSDSVAFFPPIELYSAKMVFAGADNTSPLLLVRTGSAHGVDGGHGIYSELFSFDRQSNQFPSVVSNATGSNNNQEARFFEERPLRGDVVVAEPTSSAPFGAPPLLIQWALALSRRCWNAFMRQGHP